MNLVYSTSFGAAYFFDLAQVMVDSLRATGYAGECVILTDRPHEFRGAQCIVAELGPENLWKGGITKAVNCSDYGHILFVDSDITFLKDPSHLFVGMDIKAPPEPIDIKTSGLNALYLTEAELMTWASHPSTNCGTLLMPGNKADEFWSTFEAGWKNYHWSGLPNYWPENKAFYRQMYDQSALQALIVRRQLDVFPLPQGAVGFPAVKPMKDAEGFTMLHWCGAQQTKTNKEMVMGWMQGDVNESIKAAADESAKWRAQAPQLAPLQSSIEALAAALTPFIAYTHTLEDRISKLEKKLENQIEVSYGR
jgi:hypothetical protein